MFKIRHIQSVIPSSWQCWKVFSDVRNKRTNKQKMCWVIVEKVEKVEKSVESSWHLHRRRNIDVKIEKNRSLSHRSLSHLPEAKVVSTRHWHQKCVESSQHRKYSNIVSRTLNIVAQESKSFQIWKSKLRHIFWSHISKAVNRPWRYKDFLSWREVKL